MVTGQGMVGVEMAGSILTCVGTSASVKHAAGSPIIRWRRQGHTLGRTKRGCRDGEWALPAAAAWRRPPVLPRRTLRWDLAAAAADIESGRVTPTHWAVLTQVRPSGEGMPCRRLPAAGCS